ncbi:MAG: ribosomal-protein-alanine N-acetyltransferase [Clostridiales bacterium]|nr:ribosomal-protein-alanine N-acetyltransferase [Clostridiales bacterium]
MSDIIYRRMTADDVDAVHAIELDTFAMPWKREDFVREMTQNRCARYLVAELDGNVIGFAGAWLILDEGHITNIAVRKEYRGNGYGISLTGALMQYAANLGVSYLDLEVRKSNTVAQNMYRKLGFFKVGERKKYYEDNGEDALLMVCDKLPEADPDFEEAETVSE